MLHSAGVPLDRSLSGLNLARPDLVRGWPRAGLLLASLDLSNPDHRLNAYVATKIVESQRPG